jgi:hypothetical protein
MRADARKEIDRPRTDIASFAADPSNATALRTHNKHAPLEIEATLRRTLPLGAEAYEGVTR